MMRTIKRIFNNLKWVFNHPPTHITVEEPAVSTCDYCGITGNVYCFHWVPLYVCPKCFKKALDAVLKPTKDANHD